MSTTMTLRLDDDIKDRLETLAGATQRSKSYLAAEAVRAYVELNEWQIQETRHALTEAEAGDFASADDMAALAAKWADRADRAEQVDRADRADRSDRAEPAEPGR